MTSTAYKNIPLPTVGSDVGVWGGTLNTSTFPIFDAALGGISTVSLSSSNVTLSSAQSGSAILRLVGTLTANVQVTTSCQGFQFVENLTSGAFTVTITNGVGTAFILPQGIASLVIFDTTNGSRYGHQEFQSGTTTVFFQATAPINWTQNTSYNDFALRVVASTGGGVNASGQAFSAAVATGSVDGHALSADELPVISYLSVSGSTIVGYLPTTNSGFAAHTIPIYGVSIGAGAQHGHTFTSAAINPKTIDMILCTRD